MLSVKPEQLYLMRNGEHAVYIVRLLVKPSSPVEVHARPTESERLQVFPSHHTFDLDSWNAPKLFQVRVADTLKSRNSSLNWIQYVIKSKDEKFRCYPMSGTKVQIDARDTPTVLSSGDGKQCRPSSSTKVCLARSFKW